MDGAEFFARADRAGWLELTLDPDGRQGRTWYGPGGPRPYQPDHVFGDPGTANRLRSATIEAYPVETLGLSDHAPLVLELELDATAHIGEEGSGAREGPLVDAHA